MTIDINRPPAHPLIARLVEATGRSVLVAANLADFLALSGNTVIFCGGDPAKYPECLDVAVILPELMAGFDGRFQVGVAASELESELHVRYGFQRWPSLIFLRDGNYLGVLSGMQDWPVYLARIAELLDQPVSRPPSVGISVSRGQDVQVSATCG